MLPEGLDASAVRGYRLRFSPLAQQLRDSVVTDDEQYFQSLFDRLVKLEQDPSPQAQAVIRQELRAQMGDLAFDRFWSSRDPLFLPVENYLVGQGFARRQVFDAYSIINRSQESLLGAIANNRSQDSMLSAVQQIRTDESADLARLLGDEIAAGLAGAMAEAAISLSSVSKTSC
jgi:hypothetical protein